MQLGYGIEGSIKDSIGGAIGTGDVSLNSALDSESARSHAVARGDLNGDGILDLVTAGVNDLLNGYATVRLGVGNGTFASATTKLILESNGGASSVHALAIGDVNGDGVNDILTSGSQYDGFSSNDGKVGVLLGQTKDGLGAMLDFSLKTKSDAKKAMGPLQRLQENLAKQRGVIGASQSRVTIALQSLASSKENFSAAESRISDADIAADAANLVRTQILQQAATAILAQATQAPSLVLTLLK